jgi:hypothetical protein
MIKPLLQDFDFFNGYKKAELEVDKLHLWWLGQSAYLILWRDRHLLLDPYLSDSLTEKYAGTDTPHVRMTERVVDPRQLDFIDVVASSHNHSDHLDGETISPLLAVNRVVKARSMSLPNSRVAVVMFLSLILTILVFADYIFTHKLDQRCRFNGYRPC